MFRARRLAGLEQKSVEQRESPHGRRRWGPSEARCVPLVRLLLLSDPGSWCSRTRKRLGQLPGLCSAHGGAAGHEQRSVDQRESPRGCCRWGPSEARCAPLVRLLLLSDPGSWCSGTGRGLGQLPGLCSAGGGANGLELRRSLWLEAGSYYHRPKTLKPRPVRVSRFWANINEIQNRHEAGNTGMCLVGLSSGFEFLVVWGLPLGAKNRVETQNQEFLSVLFF